MAEKEPSLSKGLEAAGSFIIYGGAGSFYNKRDLKNMFLVIKRNTKILRPFLSDMEKGEQELFYLVFEDPIDMQVLSRAAKKCKNDLEILYTNSDLSGAALIWKDMEKVAGVENEYVLYLPGETEAIRQYGILQYGWNKKDQELLDIILKLGTK